MVRNYIWKKKCLYLKVKSDIIFEIRAEMSVYFLCHVFVVLWPPKIGLCYYVWVWYNISMTMRANAYYRISANSFRGNYSFLEVEVRKLFKGGNYSREETINFFLFFANLYLNNSRTYFWVCSFHTKWFSTNNQTNCLMQGHYT